MKTNVFQVTVPSQKKSKKKPTTRIYPLLEEDLEPSSNMKRGILRSAALSPENDLILKFSTADYRILELWILDPMQIPKGLSMW